MCMLQASQMLGISLKTDTMLFGFVSCKMITIKHTSTQVLPGSLKKKCTTDIFSLLFHMCMLQASHMLGVSLMTRTKYAFWLPIVQNDNN